MNPVERVKVLENIKRLSAEGKTMLLLADQNLKFCRKVCDRGYIIEKGTIVHDDAMEDIWNNEEVIKKYLVL